ncbi:2,3-diaminopropionate biosynthesis protein SbnB [Paenibacillus sp. PK3_47]|uniref:2,3-diaminopropionate biosynthesis protein SbnB n=1 Tax=Paenibacillus sp. PK3_47 TaxID=2072642 RepID=UPI00201D6A50|nr:2,3-diaminopropionate biosynthesis protein SbnB [Paenibacillus sp. PK3_47]UQZ36162.1 2,3-diaminopropionate biosynthesis protein SbnB [Paenibacillus sp. PK3_47]
MLYLNDHDITAIGVNWPALVDTMESAVRILDSGDFAQPVKPYLRYNHPLNRMIAMPAYVGGKVKAAGIKWIASFPGNIQAGLPRAHSLTVLNDPETGQPSAILNSAIPSIVRTSSISGLMLRHYIQARQPENIHLGIIGWGPVGQYHVQMAAALYGDKIERIRIFDIKGADLSKVPPPYAERAEVAESWEEVYQQSNVFITCTVSAERYIDVPPAPGSLLLHVSLRDYQPEALAALKAIIVDDWNEVCRENTDIERLHLEQGLSRDGVRLITDVVCRSCLADFPAEEPVLFSPMGMAVFDIATGVYYVNEARMRGIGTEL